MRRPQSPIQTRAERLATGLLGASLVAAAGLAAGLARDHMALHAVVCGVAEVAHCGWCYAAAALGLTGLAAWGVALSPSRTAVATVRRSAV
jgi:hypothetical protein